MSDQITKIIFRRGTNAQRAATLLNQSEPGYTTDSKRLYVGDGSTLGGLPAASKNLGTVTQLFSGSGSITSYAAPFLSGAEVGDLLFDATTTILYSISAIPVTSAGSFTKYSTTIATDEVTITKDGLDQLKVVDAGIGPVQLGAVVGQGLSGGAGSAIYIPNTQGNAVKLNTSSSPALANDVVVNPKQVVGRTATGTLSAINASDLLTSAIIPASGITLSANGPNLFIGLSAAANTVAPTTTYTMVSSLTVDAVGRVSSVVSAPGAFSTGFTNLTAFATSGTWSWTVPANVTRLKIEAWGAGGSGCGYWSGSPGSGGDSGAYGLLFTNVTPGDVLNIRVGAGGVYRSDSLLAPSYARYYSYFGTHGEDTVITSSTINLTACGGLMGVAFNASFLSGAYVAQDVHTWRDTNFRSYAYGATQGINGTKAYMLSYSYGYSFGMCAPGAIAPNVPFVDRSDAAVLYPYYSKITLPDSTAKTTYFRTYFSDGIHPGGGGNGIYSYSGSYIVPAGDGAAGQVLIWY